MADDMKPSLIGMGTTIFEGICDVKLEQCSASKGGSVSAMAAAQTRFNACADCTREMEKSGRWKVDLLDREDLKKPVKVGGEAAQHPG